MLEVHFQPLDAQNEAKEAFVWAKEAGATLPVRKCAASSAGGFLSGAGAVQQAQEAHIHLLHARPRANKAICWMPEAQRHAQEAQRQACILAARGLLSSYTVWATVWMGPGDFSILNSERMPMPWINKVLFKELPLKGNNSLLRCVTACRL